MDGVEAEAWIRFLRSLRTDWWASPTFRDPPSAGQVVRAFEAWLAPFPGAYAVVGVQRGPRGNRLHPHGLIGGTGRHPLVENLLRRSWRRGNLLLAGYRPRLGGVEYLVRQADAVELVGTPRPYRPRRRGGRRRADR